MPLLAGVQAYLSDFYNSFLWDEFIDLVLLPFRSDSGP